MNNPVKDIDTLLFPKWLIPIEPANTVYENYAIAINNGKILDIDKAEILSNKYTAKQQHHLTTHAVLPGLINAHTHLAMNLFKGYADDLPLMVWLQEHIWPAEQKWVSPEFVHDGSLLAIAEMLRSGTTCFADMYFFPESTARAADSAGIRAAVGLIAIDFPTAYAQNAEDYLHKGLQLHDQLRSNNLISTVFAPHAPYTISDEPLQRIAILADELDLPIQMHIHESKAEIDEAVAKNGLRPLQRLKDLGITNPRMLAVHMTQLTDQEIELTAQSGMHVVHCPESNLKLASGFCPVQKLIAAGVNVCIGTDSASSNNDLDMFSEIRTTALLSKGVANDATVVSAETVLRMATINAAKALDLDDNIGSLEIGKAADMIAVNLDEIETLPIYDPIAQLVYATSRSQVTDSWINGKHVMKNRELTTLDINQLKELAKTWQDKIKA